MPNREQLYFKIESMNLKICLGNELTKPTRIMRFREKNSNFSLIT